MEERPLPPSHLRALANRWPTPVAGPVTQYALAHNPWEALWRGCDAIEAAVRFGTLLHLCALRAAGIDLGASGLLEGLDRPSLGSWSSALKRLTGKDPRQPEPMLLTLRSWTERDLAPLLGVARERPEESLLALRNRLAHVGPLGPKTTDAWWRRWRDRLDEALSRLDFLSAVSLEGKRPDGTPIPLRGARAVDDGAHDSAVSIAWSEGRCSASPFIRLESVSSPVEPDAPPRTALLVYFRREAPGGVEYCVPGDDLPPIRLAGDVGRSVDDAFGPNRHRSPDARGPDALANRLRQLSEGLVGREADRASLLASIANHPDDVVWLPGEPGVGKSALLASVTAELLDTTQRLVVPFFPEPGGAALLARSFNRQLCRFVDERLGPEEDPAEPRPLIERARDRLRALAHARRRPVVVIVDALDEIEEESAGFARSFVGLAGDGVGVVCSGRPDRALTEALVDAVRPLPEGLRPLAREDAMAYLRDALGPRRYVLFERGAEGFEAFIAAVADQARGIPLYLATVVADLAAGRAPFDAAQLPTGLEDAYRRSLRRSQIGDTGSVLIAAMSVLATAPGLPHGTLEALLSTHMLRGAPVWEDLLAHSLDLGSTYLRRTDGRWSLRHETLRFYLDHAAEIRAVRWWSRKAWLRAIERWGEAPDEVRVPVLREAEIVLPRIEADADETLSRDARSLRISLGTDEDFLTSLTAADDGDATSALRWIDGAAEASFADGDLLRAAEAWAVGARRRGEVLVKASDPLDLLRAGKGASAWALADRLKPREATRWKLLLLWELAATGQVEEFGARRGEVELEMGRLHSWGEAGHFYALGSAAIDAIGISRDATWRMGPAEDFWEQRRRKLFDVLSGLTPIEAGPLGETHATTDRTGSFVAWPGGFERVEEALLTLGANAARARLPREWEWDIGPATTIVLAAEERLGLRDVRKEVARLLKTKRPDVSEILFSRGRNEWREDQAAIVRALAGGLFAGRTAADEALSALLRGDGSVALERLDEHLHARPDDGESALRVLRFWANWSVARAHDRHDWWPTTRARARARVAVVPEVIVLARAVRAERAEEFAVRLEAIGRGREGALDLPDTTRWSLASEVARGGDFSLASALILGHSAADIPTSALSRAAYDWCTRASEAGSEAALLDGIRLMVALTEAFDVRVDDVAPESGARDVAQAILTRSDDDYGFPFDEADVSDVLRGVSRRAPMLAIAMSRELDATSKPVLMAQLAAELSGRGFASEVDALLDEARTMVQTWDGEPIKGSGYCAEVAKAFAHVGRLDEAMKLSDLTVEEHDLVEVQREVAVTLLRSGDHDGAVRLARQMDDTAEALLALTKAAIEIVDPSLVRALVRSLGPLLRVDMVERFCAAVAHCEPDAEPRLAALVLRFR